MVSTTQIEKYPVEILIATPDLNFDGRNDMVVYLSGFTTCGSAGCSIIALVSRDDGGWNEIFNAVNTHLPISIGKEPENGYAPFFLGGKNGSKWIFDGQRYKYSRFQYAKNKYAIDTQGAGDWHQTTNNIKLLAAPKAGSAVLAAYNAGTIMKVVGEETEAQYLYVSPCNACESGFVSKTEFYSKSEKSAARRAQ